MGPDELNTKNCGVLYVCMYLVQTSVVSVTVYDNNNQVHFHKTICVYHLKLSSQYTQIESFNDFSNHLEAKYYTLLKKFTT